MFVFMFYKLFNANSTVFLFFRSSRPEEFCKKGVLRNFTKFTGKHLCQSHFFFLQNISGGFCFFLSVSLFFPYASLYAIYLHPLLRSEVLFLFSILYSGAPFYKKKRKEKKKIFIENHENILEIVVLTDRCIIKKMISKKNVM